jgi:hypothetical protein
VPSDPLEIYQELQDAFSKDVKSEANQTFVGDVYRASCRFLAKAGSEPLKSLVRGKEYFAFKLGKKFSRAVNKQLFVAEPKEWEAFCKAIASKRAPRDGVRTDHENHLLGRGEFLLLHRPHKRR